MGSFLNVHNKEKVHFNVDENGRKKNNVMGPIMHVQSLIVQICACAKLDHNAWSTWTVPRMCKCFLLSFLIAVYSPVHMDATTERTHY